MSAEELRKLSLASETNTSRASGAGVNPPTASLSSSANLALGSLNAARGKPQNVPQADGSIDPAVLARISKVMTLPVAV